MTRMQSSRYFVLILSFSLITISVSEPKKKGRLGGWISQAGGAAGIVGSFIPGVLGGQPQPQSHSPAQASVPAPAPANTHYHHQQEYSNFPRNGGPMISSSWMLVSFFLTLSWLMKHGH